jgi:hypothetical protein
MYNTYIRPLLSYKSKSKLYYYRRSVDQSVLVSSTHLGHVTNFSFSFLLSDEKTGLILILLLVLASAVPLGSESRGTQDHILSSKFSRLLQRGEAPGPHVKVKVTLRPTISLPVRLGVRRPFGTRDQFFYFLEIFLKIVTVRYLVALSLTRGRVCNFL